MGISRASFTAQSIAGGSAVACTESTAAVSNAWSLVSG